MNGGPRISPEGPYDPQPRPDTPDSAPVPPGNSPLEVPVQQPEGVPAIDPDRSPGPGIDPGPGPSVPGSPIGLPEV
jgi:hypothetical protein